LSFCTTSLRGIAWTYFFKDTGVIGICVSPKLEFRAQGRSATITARALLFFAERAEPYLEPFCLAWAECAGVELTGFHPIQIHLSKTPFWVVLLVIVKPRVVF
jgi:hypothetical protein